MISSHPNLHIRWEKDKVKYNIESELFGSYNFQNISAAIAIADHFNVDPEKIVSGIEKYVPDNNRSQRFKTSSNTIIMDAYNANPTSMEMAINYFNAYPDAKKILILGDMMELGPVSDNEHKRIMDLALSLDFNKVIFVGDHFKQFLGPEKAFSNVYEARSWLTKNPLSGFSILIKGSRKIELEKLLDLL